MFGAIGKFLLGSGGGATAGGVLGLLQGQASARAAAKANLRNRIYNAAAGIASANKNSQEASINRDFQQSSAREAMKFNAEQASINRDFQQKSADKQMAFQERMFKNRFQNQTQDMRAAGLNPILAAGGSPPASAGAMAQASSASGVSASGSQGSSSPVSHSEMPEDPYSKVMSGIQTGLAYQSAKRQDTLAKEEVKLKKEQTRYARENIRLKRQEIQSKSMENEVKESGLDTEKGLKDYDNVFKVFAPALSVIASIVGFRSVKSIGKLAGKLIKSSSTRARTLRVLKNPKANIQETKKLFAPVKKSNSKPKITIYQGKKYEKKNKLFLP